MKEETFNLVIDKLQKAYKLESQLSGLGLSIVELNEGYPRQLLDDLLQILRRHRAERVEGYHIAIKALLMESFSTEKIDVIDWYLYEYRKGKMIISDSKTKKVLYDLDKKGDLWKYLNE